MPHDSSLTLGTGSSRRAVSLSFGVLWLGLCAFGLLALSNYESRAGNRRPSPVAWPSESVLGRTTGVPTLILFAHPHCPCTRAALEEFDGLVAQSSMPVRKHIVFYEPAALSGEAATNLQKTASAIPGAELYCDGEGAEAVRFGAETSGHVVFYDKAGKLCFSGGITASRGHAGQNAGRDALERLVNQRAPERAMAPVFGCSLFGGRSAQPASTCPP